MVIPACQLSVEQVGGMYAAETRQAQEVVAEYACVHMCV